MIFSCKLGTENNTDVQGCIWVFLTKAARRNINNLRYADDIILMAEN